MPSNEKKLDTAKKNGEKSQNYFYTMRRNVDKLMDEKNMTIKQLTELSGLNMETVKTFLYDKESKDCRLSTAIGIAKAFGLTVAELAETETMDDNTVENMKLYRSLPDSSKALVDFIAKQQKFLHEEHKSNRIISVMQPVCHNNGNLKKTNIYDPLNIDNIGNESIHRIFMGIKIPCEHHLPYYMKGDILLIANDRDAHHNEHTVIIVNDNIIITKRVLENGKPKYYGIRDNVLRSEDDDRIYVLGYIVKVINN